jgi:hypothetical protein
LVGGLLLIRRIANYEEKIMHVFLEVPRKTVLQYNTTCEVYTSEIQVNNPRRFLMRLEQ